MATFTEGVFTITSPIQHRRGTTEALEASDYIPAAGEIVIATDTGLIKAGDGVHTWRDLPDSNQFSSELENRVANIERLLRDVNLDPVSTEPDDTDDTSEDNIDEVFDNIFSNNNSSEPDTSNNDGFDDTINSILNP